MKASIRKGLVVYGLAVLVLLTATTAGAKDNSVKGDAEAGPISCTADVVTSMCQKIREAFASLQSIPLVSQIEIVVADPVAFSNESERLTSQHQKRVTTALDSKVEGDKLVKIVNRRPTAPSSLSNSILLVLDDDRTIRAIRKVVVSTDLFRDLDLSGKSTVDKDNVVHFAHGSFSPELLDSWSKYIAGYIEGWNGGRFEVISQQ